MRRLVAAYEGRKASLRNADFCGGAAVAIRPSRCGRSFPRVEAAHAKPIALISQYRESLQVVDDDWAYAVLEKVGTTARSVIRVCRRHILTIARATACLKVRNFLLRGYLVAVPVSSLPVHSISACILGRYFRWSEGVRQSSRALDGVWLFRKVVRKAAQSHFGAASMRGACAPYRGR